MKRVGGSGGIKECWKIRTGIVEYRNDG